MKPLSICFYGNMNNLPFYYAELFRSFGHRVRLIVNRKDILHRPESLHPEWKNNYPDWILDYSHITDEQLAQDDSKIIAPLLHELRRETNLVMLNDSGPALAGYLYCPHGCILTGSDLTYYANYEMLSWRMACWNPERRRSIEGRLYASQWSDFITRQRDGILTSDLVLTFARGVSKEVDRLFDSIGVTDDRRIMPLISNINLKFHPPAMNPQLVLLNGARVLFNKESKPGMSDLDFKGTDILLRGFAGYIKRGGRGILKMVNKGQDAALARQLIDDLDISDHIIWLPEMPLGEFYRELIASDILCDQFDASLPAMAVSDALAMGRPVLANLRNDIFTQIHGEPLVGLNAISPEEVTDWLCKVDSDRELLAALGQRGREYAEKYLDREDIVQRILDKVLFPQDGPLMPVDDLLRLRHTQLMRLFVLFLRILRQVPGLTFFRRIHLNIRKNGFLFFLKSISPGQIINRWITRIRYLMIFGGRSILDSAFDVQWPSPQSLPPVKLLSQDALAGKPSVCLIAPNMSAGGAERQVAGLACELKRRGYQVRVRVMRLDGENGHYLPFLTEQGVDIAVPKPPRFKDIRWLKEQGINFSLLKHLPPELRLESLALICDLYTRPVDVVHCYLDWCCCYGGFAALLSKVPSIRFSWRNVNPSHFDFFRDWMPPLYSFFLSFPHVRLESNTASGALDYAQWLKIPAERIEVIPNGLAPELLNSKHKEDISIRSRLLESLGIPKDAPLIVSMGRLSDEKRPLDLPDILRSLRKKIPGAVLVHIGTGPLKNALKERMNLAQLTGSRDKNAGMFLLGAQKDVLDIMNAADAFLLTSAYEGMPNVVMEAMFAGIPIVATRVGGVLDLVQDGVHGFLHTLGDISGMARSLEKILLNPELKKTMGLAGQKRIRSEFMLQHLADRVTNAYSQQCAESQNESCLVGSQK